jgi:hypothetical protein
LPEVQDEQQKVEKEGEEGEHYDSPIKDVEEELKKR